MYRRALRNSGERAGLTSQLGHAEAVIGSLRDAGFSLSLTLHAHTLLDSYTHGFALQETSLPVSTVEESDAFAGELLEVMGQTYPHLAEFIRARAWIPSTDSAWSSLSVSISSWVLAEMHAAEKNFG